jgi:hypothetical protein
MKPDIAPIAMPPRKVELCDRAPTIEPMKQMRAANPQPIQKMEGIKWAPYRTDTAKESATDS